MWPEVLAICLLKGFPPPPLLNIKVPPARSCLIQFRIMTLPAACRGRAQGERDGDEHYLVILSAASWAPALHSLQIELFSQSRIQYLLDDSIFTKALCHMHDWGDRAAVRILSKTRYMRHLRVRLGELRGRELVSHLQQWDTDARCTGTVPVPRFLICVCKEFCAGFARLGINILPDVYSGRTAFKV